MAVAQAVGTVIAVLQEEGMLSTINTLSTVDSTEFMSDVDHQVI